MTDGALALAEARLWIGTPYLHQASAKGIGTDCLGLLRGIWRSLYGDEPELVPAYTPDWGEATRDEVLLKAARRCLCERPVGDAMLGDVLLFRMREDGVAKHLGVQSQIGAHPRFIHSYTSYGVIESSLSMPWQRRIAARFSFPVGTK